ncbi:RNA-binding S4 domain-containing protein [Frateuria terrea]|uniref:Heat shock protein 15 n=1 Tax=Frateuria terrea TaxID=529704 RepID=A0A1H6QXN6_9GAMM|nr:S4 domain-containing protein [Frateuria terrea]SEI46856.1 ribosome-associated heat shock protein Hsp15 [Frateuria terrea]SFP12718.1 ribosome-associated heat shock protein Hsp15 [Frateuria terrea]
MSEVQDHPQAVRADVWLWAARFFKTRSLAKQAIDGGKVDLNGAGCKPSKAVHVGDRLQIGRGEERIEVVVAALSGQRGPAPVAQALYRETEESLAAREAARAQRRLGAAGLLRPPTRPDKQARRQIMKFKDEQSQE